MTAIESKAGGIVELCHTQNNWKSLKDLTYLVAFLCFLASLGIKWYTVKSFGVVVETVKKTFISVCNSASTLSPLCKVWLGLVSSHSQ